MNDDRSADLVTRLGAIRARIADACAAAGRAPQDVTLIAVTKGFPASDIATLIALGVRDLGESRDQEARAKLADLALLRSELPALDSVRWHMIGQLQTNKSRSVVGYAHLVHTVDRAGLVEALSRAVTTAGRRPLDVLLQLSLDGDPARGGVGAAELAALAESAEAAPGLRLRGLMAVAPKGWEPARAYADLGAAAQRMRARHPEADLVSAGMSGDFEAAITAGATHVRVGTALLGSRAALLG
jgi:pyridoxal phosphate enzyme (YggS family)